ncbi:hypothetical protein GUJ93_ZPchr0008g12864 [Zizania palustris]|uniref:Uncharacterized protein n=1 Tax=Zizania palustris TaxID=103762 RepID=A0A8J5RIY0_ZIZPA|nr:hypothetical protein GUJ93_ZPchr0008g12864 [Zizania palustris]
MPRDHRANCSRNGDEHDFFYAAQLRDLDVLGALLATNASLAHRATLYDHLSVLHIATANGSIKTSLMIVAMHSKIDCVLKLL